MKNLFAKFLSLSLKMKIITVAVPSVLVIGAVATPIIINANKEPLEAPIDVAEATVEPTIESTEEPTTAPVIEKTEDETVIEPEVVEPEVEETVVEETTEVVETEVEETEVEVTETPEKEVVSSEVDAYIPPDAGQTYTYPGDDKIGSYTVTIPDKYDMPYIVNGIDIRDGDIDGDGVTDNSLNTWYKGQYFVGSNGVKVRIADAYRVDAEGMIPHPDAIFRDGTENIEPTSEWQKAISEYLGEYTRLNMDPSSLPSVSTVSSKQTTFDKNNASFVAYKNAFDPMWQMQNVGHSNEMSLSCLQPFDNNQDGVFDGVGLIDSAPGKLGYMWEMKYDSGNGYWKLVIKGNYTELIWNSIHNSIRMITPDADAVYNAIYEDCYNYYFESTDVFYPVGNTEVMVKIENGTLYYYIR